MHALPKEGHIPKAPKLCGIALAPVIARLYDCVLDMRLQHWYVPNREQAGLRSGQGCLFQIFIVVLHNSSRSRTKIQPNHRVPRLREATIISKHIQKGCGHIDLRRP